MDDNKKAEETNGQAAGEAAGRPNVVWDDSNMKTAYANVVNAISSREEVMLFFGTNQTWNIEPGKELTVGLTDRIILNPHAAKRLFTLLAAVLAQYEKRHGKINIDPRSPGPAEVRTVDTN